MSIRRRLLLGLGALAVLLLAIIVIGVLVIRTSWAKDHLRALAVTQAARALNGELSIGRLGGTLFTGVVLDDVTLTQDGIHVVDADQVTLKYSVISLVRELTFAEISVLNPRIRVVETSAGWNVANLLRPSGTPSRAPRPFAIHRLLVSGGAIEIEPRTVARRSLNRVELDASLAREADGVAMRISRLTGAEETTGYTIAAFSGAFRRSFAEATATFDFAREASLATGRVDLRLAARGRSVTTAVDLTAFDLATILGTPRWTSDITGHARVQGVVATGASPSLQFSFVGPHAKALGYEGQDIDLTGSLDAGLLQFKGRAGAYDAQVSTDARWRFADAKAGGKAGFVATGDFRRAQLRNLPSHLVLPRFDTMLNGRYQIRTDARGWAAGVTLNDSRFEGAALHQGTAGHVESHNGLTRYHAEGELAGLDPQRLAAPLQLPILAEERFHGTLIGTFKADGQLPANSDQQLTADASLVDSSLGGAQFGAMTLKVALAGPRLDVRAEGDFEGVTAKLAGTGESVPFDLTGTANVGVTFHDLHAPLTLETLDISGQVTLQPSTARGLAVQGGIVDGELLGGTATIRRLTLDAAGLHLEAKGTAALGDSGTSSLQVTAASDSLALMGEALGLDLSGAADVTAEVTGPAGEPHATGTLNARALNYGTTSALTLDATFDATVPMKDPAAVQATSKIEATFVKAAGLEIARLGGTAGYGQRQVTIDTRIEQEARTLEMAGVVSLDPERRNVTLRRFQIETSGNVWALPDLGEARIALGADQAAIDGLVLTHDGQRIEIGGTVVLGDEPIDAAPPLTIRAERVQLADLNRLLLSTRQVEGLLSATATLDGPIRSPDVTGDFVIVNGQVEQMPFNAARGKVHYAGSITTVDVELQQTSQYRLTVAGSVATPSATATQPGLNLTVKSTPIDLGLVQAFTTELTDVAGTGVFDVRVTGQTDAPVIDGDITIEQGRFALSATEERYRELNAQLHFEQNFLTIRRFVVADDDGHQLKASGGLDVIGQPGAERTLDVRISADDFHLLANKSGNLQIDSELQATGSFVAPKISGTIRVTDGRLEVDRILETTTRSVYSTRPEVEEEASPALPRDARTDAAVPPSTTAAATANAGNASSTGSATPPGSGSAQPASGGAAAPSPPGLFDRVDLAVKLELPDNLVLRGRDLRVGGSSIGLGDVNIVTGGSLDIQKRPGEPIAILGSMEVDRGYYSFQGRRFEVQRDSTVQFRGQLPIDPSLDVTATREISGIETVVHVQGTMREPTISLSSRPPLDDADVLSLIVFGQQINDLGSTERGALSERVASMAAGAIATPISDSVARALNLDLFEIQAPSGSGAPAVSLGSQIGSRLYVGLRQEVGLGDRRVLSLEYRLSDVLRLVTSIAQGVPEPHTDRRTEASGVDLIFQRRY